MARCKRKVSARLQAARDVHSKFLAKHGIGDPKPLRGVDLPDLSVRVNAPTSDKIPAHMPAKEGPGGTLGLVIGQPYHKGPLMVLGSKDDLKTNKRRQ